MIERQPLPSAAPVRASLRPLAALLVVGLDLLGLYAFLGQRHYLQNPIWIYLTLYAVAFGLYLYAAGRIAPRIPALHSSYAVPLIVGLAIAYRLLVVPAPPSLSTDIYLYCWNGKLILHGINPYHWAPNANPLRFLRDSYWEQTEYKSYQSIYMPVSQAFFALNYALFGHTLIGYKLVYALCDCAVMGLLAWLLHDLGLPISRVIWYAWSPLPITEIALAGHQDVVGVLFLLLAFVLARRGIGGGAAVVLVAAALTKGFGLLLLPLFARAYGRQFTMFALVALIYLGMPLWVFLPNFTHGMRQYLDNVHVNAGVFHWLNSLLTPVTRWHFQVTSFLSDAAIIGVTVWAAWRPVCCFTDVLRRAFVVLAVTLLVVPTLFPWYLVWLLPFLPLLGRRPSAAFVLLTGLVCLLYTFYLSMLPYSWLSYVEYGPFYALLAWEYYVWRREQRANLPKRATLELTDCA